MLLVLTPWRLCWALSWVVGELKVPRWGSASHDSVFLHDDRAVECVNTVNNGVNEVRNRPYKLDDIAPSYLPCFLGPLSA